VSDALFVRKEENVADSPSVLVVGAGPTGLALAVELAGLGIRCRVLERRAAPGATSRAFGLMPRTLEQFDMRGYAERFVEQGLQSAEAPLGDLRSFLHYGDLDTPFPYILIIPQSRTERILESLAVEAGVEIVRGAEVTGLTQDADSVTVQVREGDRDRVERAEFVVGCDGGHGVVRELAGIEMNTRTYDQSLVIADVVLSRPPTPDVNARISNQGMVAVFPFGDGVYRLVVLDRDRMSVPVEEPVTIEEVRRSADVIFGSDLGVDRPVWLSRFRSVQRQATGYRAGRVLLAGDAAHAFNPSGGQGLQFGVQDAMNLGWKLAAEIAGWAPPGLLDSYESERKPIAAETLRKTDLNFRFEASHSTVAKLARKAGMWALAFRPIQPPLIAQFAGFSLRYPTPGAHRLVGRRLPDARIEVAGGPPARLFELVRERKFVLLDQGPGGAAARLARDGWADRVTVPSITRIAGRRWPDVVLLRPDGYVAYAGRAGRPDELQAALRQWCGQPTHDVAELSNSAIRPRTR
jgi:2-polyprenyl-6-methoxyphenol hydroxylase-like FAD-dependent oxidoreductase